MIHVSIEAKPPPTQWTDESDKLTAALSKLNGTGDVAARNALIDKNDHHWKKLTAWMKDLSHDKCWYSEAKDCAAYWHVDHWRPKKKVKDCAGNESDGYWWLAFKWQNYRLAGSAVNVPKSTIFPVRKGTMRVTAPHQDENDESPYLLDPCNPADPGLLSFEETGKAIPGDPAGDWNRRRSEVTIDVLNLNYDGLTRGRHVCWEECDRRVNKVLNLMGDLQMHPSVAKQTELRDTICELRKMAAQDAQFSAAVATCVRSQGVNWLTSQVLQH